MICEGHVPMFIPFVCVWFLAVGSTVGRMSLTLPSSFFDIFSSCSCPCPLLGFGIVLDLLFDVRWVPCYLQYFESVVVSVYVLVEFLLAVVFGECHGIFIVENHCLPCAQFST